MPMSRKTKSNTLIPTSMQIPAIVPKNDAKKLFIEVTF
jgi:hypothetical protein